MQEKWHEQNDIMWDNGWLSYPTDVLRTPCYIACPEVECNVMNALYFGQIHPPCGGLSIVIWYSTLAGLPRKIRFLSIYSVTGVKSAVLFGYIWCGYCWYAGLFSAILTVKIEKKYVDLKRYFIHKFQYTKIHSVSIYTKMFSTLTHYFVYTCNWTGSAFFLKLDTDSYVKRMYET